MSNVINHILGTSDYAAAISLVIFALIGIFISLLIHSTNKDKSIKFSFKYLLGSNWKRILLSFILVLVVLRFSHDIIGLDSSDFTALLIGISVDKLSELLKNKEILVGNPPKQP